MRLAIVYKHRSSIKVSPHAAAHAVTLSSFSILDLPNRSNQVMHMFRVLNTAQPAAAAAGVSYQSLVLEFGALRPCYAGRSAARRVREPTTQESRNACMDQSGSLSLLWLMPTTVFSMTISAKSSPLHPGSQLLSTLISLLAPSASPTASHALHYFLHSCPSHLPSPLLLLLLLLGSPSEIQEFSLS